MRKRNPETVKRYNREYWQRNKETLLLKQYARLAERRKLKALKRGRPRKTPENIIVLPAPETIKRNRERLLKRAEEIRVNRIRLKKCP